MIVVIALMLVWLSIHVLAALPCKLPLPVNVLLYMLLSIIVINKFTVLGFKYRMYEMSQEIPDFIATVLHRDFTFTLSLLIFANAFIGAKRRSSKLWISIATFSFIFITGQFLRMEEAITYKSWNLFYESILVVSLMVIAYLLARGLLAISRKETHHAREHHP